MTNNFPIKDLLGPVLQAESDLIGQIDDRLFALMSCGTFFVHLPGRLQVSVFFLKTFLLYTE